MPGSLVCASRLRGVCCALLAAALLTACGGRQYSDGDLRGIEAVRYGRVVDVADVLVKEEKSLAPAVAGGVVGGMLGSYFGMGTGRELFALAGAAAGAHIGYGSDLTYRRYPALQLTIELDGGRMIMVVQGYTEYFVRGDRVRVVGLGDGRAVVQHE
ncbi:MAG: glycine zipper 2TM domain-containing protein [Desulfovibrio sp.]|jgi:outer membrane lipoprotein SlyB|nr:glycine zipper 2TM domain-containing protein [Desulfovibrio sp.]